MPQGPREGTFALGECETSGRRVQMRPPAGCGATRVGCDEPGSRLRSLMVLRVRPCDDPQQLTLGGSFSASDARPYGTVGACRDVELWNHRRPVYRRGEPLYAELVALKHHGAPRRRLRRPRPRHVGLAAALPADVELTRGDAGVVPPRGLVPRPGHPARARPVAARGPPPAAPALRSAERQPVRAGGQHRRPAGGLRRAAGQRGAARLRRSPAGRRAPRDPLPDDDLAAFDGGALAVRVREAARPLRGDLRDRGLRQGRGARESRPRSASGSSRSATRTSPRTSPRRACRSTSPSSTPTPSTGTPRKRSSASTARRCAAAPRRRPTRCRSWSPSSTSRSGARGDDDHLVPELVVDRISGG